MDKTIEKPDDFVNTQRLLESANDSARHFRNVFAAYLTVMIYTLVVILSADQELLFKAGDKQLPLVHITIPIKEFFIYMPWALLVMHFYLLIQVSFLANKVRDYIARIGKRLRSQERNKAHRLLFPVPLAHTFGAGKSRWILSLIIFVSLVIFPLVTLIAAQVKFLPYQSEEESLWVTRQHRIIIMIDLALLWYFWYKVYISKNKNLKKAKLSKRFLYFILVFASTLITLLIIASVYVLDFPSKNPTLFENLNLSQFRFQIRNFIPKIILNHNHFYLRDSILVRREPLPEILATYYIRGGELATKPYEAVWCEFAEPLNLRNRNLRGAILSDTKICNADLIQTDFMRADLEDADLMRADLTEANLTEAYLAGSDFTGAIFIQADLTEANLEDANLTRTDFWRALLTEAYLGRADFTVADLSQAILTGAILRETNFTGADLSSAVLTRAYLENTDFTAADLSEAILTEADLTEVDFTGADLSKAILTKAILTKADFFGADLSRANFASATIINTTSNYSWIQGDPNTEYPPIGIPKGWKNTLKPDYLCPQRFYIGTYIDFSKYVNKKRKLKDKERKLIYERRELMYELALSGSKSLRTELKSLQDALEELKSELRTEVAEVIEDNCKPYEPKTP